MPKSTETIIKERQKSKIIQNSFFFGLKPRKINGPDMEREIHSSEKMFSSLLNFESHKTFKNEKREMLKL